MCGILTVTMPFLLHIEFDHILLIHYHLRKETFLASTTVILSLSKIYRQLLIVQGQINHGSPTYYDVLQRICVHL
jgi:hypothetical protein